jgi:4,5-dihydroxyphthalate decarboxylase
MFSAMSPNAYLARDPRIKRIYEDPVAVEQDYYARTGVYPIMHLIALRKDFVEKYPWAPMNIYTAFEEAKNLTVSRIWDTGGSKMPVPWYQWMMRDVEKIMDWNHLTGDFWPYGVEKNRTTLEAFLRWCFEQGVTARKLEVDELFAPQMASRVKI